jgi:triacylglycerol esterase/lipase EstA (alpha/beta hydrolase family)
MQSAEARDVGRVAAAVLGHGTRLVRGAHLAISGTVHRAVRAGVGPAATPVLVAQEVVTRSVYALTGLGLSVAARSAGLVAVSRLRAGDESAASVHDGPAAHHVLAVGLGLIGDRAAAETASLERPMHVRRGGRAVDLTPAGISSSYARVTPQLAVFVHGLFETENAWRLRTRDRPSYAARLREELDLTPVMVRFNTGLRVSGNGVALRDLLADLVTTWPVPVERIVLVGHSMGGLVIHSALAQASDETDGVWLSLVSDTVTLGSPHHGSPIARGVDRAALALSTAERTRWAGDLLGVRSAGVRDMELGASRGSRRTGIRHRSVVGVVGDLLPARWADALGDLVVPVACAAGGDDGARVVRGDHLGLLNHPEVHEHLVRWLGEPGPHGELSTRHS